MSRLEMERDAVQKLGMLTRRWQALGNQVLARLGVSNSTGWCLVYLSRMGENARQSDLAKIVGVREATLVRTLGQLEKAGLIERSPNPNDARANIMQITSLGRSLVTEIESVLTALRQDILTDVTDQELETLIKIFTLADARIAEKRG